MNVRMALPSKNQSFLPEDRVRGTISMRPNPQTDTTNQFRRGKHGSTA